MKERALVLGLSELPATELDPAARLAAVRIVVRPMDGSAALAPLVDAAKADRGARLDRHSWRQVEIVGEEQRVPVPQAHDEALVSGALPIVGEDTFHGAARFHPDAGTPCAERVLDGPITDRLRATVRRFRRCRRVTLRSREALVRDRQHQQRHDPDRNRDAARPARNEQSHGRDCTPSGTFFLARIAPGTWRAAFVHAGYRDTSVLFTMPLPGSTDVIPNVLLKRVDDNP